MRIHAAAVALFVALIVVAGVAPALASQNPPANPPAQATASQEIKGDLVRVDVEGKMLAVKSADGNETQLAFNDKTVVTGARGGVAGLATMKDQKVTVQYTEDAQSKAKTATRIIVEAKAQ